MHKQHVILFILLLSFFRLSSQNYHDNYNYPRFVSELHIYADNMMCIGSGGIYWHRWKNMDYLMNNCSFYMRTSQGQLIEDFYQLFRRDSNLIQCTFENDTLYRFEGMSNIYAEFEPIIVVRFVGAFDECGKRRWDEVYAIDQYGFIVDGLSSKYMPNKKIMLFLETFLPKKMYFKFKEYKTKH